VSRETFEQALRRTPGARPIVTEELPIGWDEADATFLRTRPSSAAPIVAGGDGLLHLVYVGTLLPAGYDTLRAFFAALARARERDGATAARIRVHFFGTSNQRSSTAPPRALAVAAEFGVQDLVSEQPGRLDYFDALQALASASGVLLLGSHEPHYTPSKVFPAMCSGRPLLAIFHEQSTATDVLRRFGGAPAVRLLTYDDRRPAPTLVDDIATAIGEWSRHPASVGGTIDRRVLDAVSARSLAGRLASVFDRVAAV
jgi:hypothetical protein